MISSLVLFAAGLLAQAAAPASPVVGIFQGVLDASGTELGLALHVDSDDEGGFVAKLDSIDQQAFGMNASTVEVRDRHMHLVWSAMHITMDCDLADDGQMLEVRFEQNALNTTLQMRRVEEVDKTKRPPPKRPQVPTAPYPYLTEDVTFDSMNEDVELAGTLTLPKGDGPFRAVVLVSGSGAQDRDESLLGHRPFLVLADHLTRQGIAVLRYDDRGTAQSTGNFGAATSLDFADDALGAVAFLKTHARIDAKHIGVAGHSEGGLIAPICATRSTDVAFIVLLAGPGVPGDEILRLQNALIAKAMGASDAEVAVATKLNARLYGLIKTEPLGPQLSGKLLAVIEEAKQSATTDAERKEYEQAGIGVSQIATPWFKTFLAYDPRPTLRQVKCPVLALNGEKDLQVPPREDLAEIEKALKEAGNEHVTIREMPGLNHLFQPCTTGSPAEYAAIETTMSPAVLEAVSTFVTGVK